MFIVFYVDGNATEKDMAAITELRKENYVQVQDRNAVRVMNCDKAVMAAKFESVVSAYEDFKTELEVVAVKPAAKKATKPAAKKAD